MDGETEIALGIIEELLSRIIRGTPAPQLCETKRVIVANRAARAQIIT